MVSFSPSQTLKNIPFVNFSQLLSCHLFVFLLYIGNLDQNNLWLIFTKQSISIQGLKTQYSLETNQCACQIEVVFQILLVACQSFVKGEECQPRACQPWRLLALRAVVLLIHDLCLQPHSLCTREVKL